MAGERKDLPCWMRVKLLPTLRSWPGSNILRWRESGATGREGLMSKYLWYLLKTPLWSKESSRPCTYEVRVAAEGKKHDCNGAAWMGSALETGWGSWRSKWSSEQSHCFYALSGWLGCMHSCSGCVPRELFQSDPAGRTADPGQIRKFTCFI